MNRLEDLQPNAAVRGDLQRCLVVCPGSPVGQWQDELYCRFHLPFAILTNGAEERQTRRPRPSVSPCTGVERAWRSASASWSCYSTSVQSWPAIVRLAKQSTPLQERLR